MMKAIRTTLVLALLLMVTTAQAQRGSWKGELDVQGIKLPLVFHFTDKGCTMDSPTQNVRGIPTQTVVKGDSVTVEIAMIGARFEGVNKGTEIVGTFTQQGMAFPLTLMPGEVTLTVRRRPSPPSIISPRRCRLPTAASPCAAPSPSPVAVAARPLWC